MTQAAITEFNLIGNEFTGNDYNVKISIDTEKKSDQISAVVNPLNSESNQIDLKESNIYFQNKLSKIIKFKAQDTKWYEMMLYCTSAKSLNSGEGFSFNQAFGSPELIIFYE